MSKVVLSAGSVDLKKVLGDSIGHNVRTERPKAHGQERMHRTPERPDPHEAVCTLPAGYNADVSPRKPTFWWVMATVALFASLGVGKRLFALGGTPQLVAVFVGFGGVIVASALVIKAIRITG